MVSLELHPCGIVLIWDLTHWIALMWDSTHGIAPMLDSFHGIAKCRSSLHPQKTGIQQRIQFHQLNPTWVQIHVGAIPLCEVPLVKYHWVLFCVGAILCGCNLCGWNTMVTLFNTYMLLKFILVVICTFHLQIIYWSNIDSLISIK